MKLKWFMFFCFLLPPKEISSEERPWSLHYVESHERCKKIYFFQAWHTFPELLLKYINLDRLSRSQSAPSPCPEAVRRRVRRPAVRSSAPQQQRQLVNGVSAVAALGVAAAVAEGNDAGDQAQRKQYAAPEPSVARCGISDLAHLDRRNGLCFSTHSQPVV